MFWHGTPHGFHRHIRVTVDQITFRLAGNDGEPLIMHNGLLADREYTWTKQVAAITGKRKKTDEDHAEIARLEWRGGLYYDETAGPYLPGYNIRRSILDAGRLSKEGKTIERGLLSIDRVNPIVYHGPRTPEAMYADGRFAHRALIKVGTSRVVRVRPQFLGWSCDVSITFDTLVLDRANLIRMAETAGTFIGVGDGRPFYGGRFSVEVVA